VCRRRFISPIELPFFVGVFDYRLLSASRQVSSKVSSLHKVSSMTYLPPPYPTTNSTSMTMLPPLHQIDREGRPNVPNIYRSPPSLSSSSSSSPSSDLSPVTSPSLSESSLPTTPAPHRRKTPSSWDPHDDLLLRHLKEQLKLGWKEIAAYFPNRTTNACQFRWRRLVSGTLRGQNQVSSAPTTAPQSPPSENDVDRSSRTSSISSNMSSNSLTMMTTTNWTKDQDDLLLSRKDLRPEELCLILGRTEKEIEMRTRELDGYNGIANHYETIRSEANFREDNVQQHPRPQLRKGSHFDGLRLPVPIVQRPRSSSEVAA
jgi:hypothetical protein